MKHFALLGMLMLFVLVVSGCAQGNDAPAVVQAYLQARVESNVDKLRSLSCAANEAQAVKDADTFKAMNAVLQGVTCHTDGTDGDYTLVSCDGKIVTTYNGESREWALKRYRTIQEGGDWKICGEG